MTLSAAPRKLPYEVWDVFSSKPLAGNPLAIFPNASALTDSDMLSIARELRLSETTFIFPSVHRGKGTRVRIFTPDQELPFAGHPALGTAMHLWNAQKRTAAGCIDLDLNIGTVPVDFELAKNGLWFGNMLQPDPIFAERHTIQAVAPLLGLNPSDFDATFPVENVSTGRPNLIVILKSLAVIRRVRIEWNRVAQYFASGDAQRGFYLLTRECESPQAIVHARKLTRALEDPATGSAAGSAAAWLVAHNIAKSGEQVLIEQGSEMKRPSELFVSAEKVGGKIRNVRVGGHAVRVIAGEFLF